MWKSKMVLMLRDMIFDTDPSAYMYSNERLEQVLVSSAFWVKSNMSFSVEYLPDVECVDISPDPTEEPRDDDFVVLTCMRAACIVLGSEFKTQARQAVRVTDGPSTIDMTESGRQIKAIYDDAVKAFERAKLQYMVGDQSAGKSITSPTTGSNPIVYPYPRYNR